MTVSPRRPTLRDVAQAAGVSEMTVSRALRGAGVVSKATRERVGAAVDRLGYVPNRLAGSLATSRSGQVAVIIPSLVNHVFTEVLSGASAVLEKAGYDAVIGISDYNLEREEKLIRSMLSWRPAGLIVPNRVHTERARGMMRGAGIPIVQLMNITPAPIDISVGVDQEGAARALARYMLGRGYRRFGYVGWNADDHSAMARSRVIEAELAARGCALTVATRFDRPVNFADGKAGLGALLAAAPETDAVFFSNDTAATGGMIHCIEAGIDVPGRLAIAGFSGLESGQNLPRPLTTIRTNRLDIGRTAARCVLNRLVGQTGPRVIDVGFDLIEGGTA